LEQLGAFIRHHPGRDIALMVERRVLQKI
jgi:hypothetical protein